MLINIRNIKMSEFKHIVKKVTKVGDLVTQVEIASPNFTEDKIYPISDNLRQNLMTKFVSQGLDMSLFSLGMEFRTAYKYNDKDTDVCKAYLVPLKQETTFDSLPE